MSNFDLILFNVVLIQQTKKNCLYKVQVILYMFYEPLKLLNRIHAKLTFVLLLYLSSNIEFLCKKKTNNFLLSKNYSN